MRRQRIFLVVLLPAATTLLFAYQHEVEAFVPDQPFSTKDRRRRRLPLQAKKNYHKKSHKPSRFAQTVHNNQKKTITFSSNNRSKKAAAAAPAFRKDRMWRSNKSIDELEAKLAERWGTDDLRRWTAADDESLEDELEYATDVQVWSTSSRHEFRGRPVRDPWADDQADDGRSDGVERKRSGAASSSSSSAAAVPLPSAANQKASPLSAFAPKQQQQSTSRAASNNNKNKIMDLKHLIRDQPVGGRGTNVDAAPAQQKTAREKVKPSLPKKEAVPVTDDHGNPIYLTTEQAQAFFEASLLEESKDDDENIAAVDNDSSPLSENDPDSTIATTWQDLGVTHPRLLQNLHDMGCPTPLAVQRNSGAAILQPNTDVVIGTYTGSGKTLAFLVPLLQRLLTEHQDDDPHLPPLSVLIVAPGRELASQIASVARELTRDLPATVLLAIGGTTFPRNLDQIRKRKPTILVGTPGRVAELVVGRAGEKRGRLMGGGGGGMSQNLQTVVLDECDALLEYRPHRDPTTAILETLKRARGDELQTILCSATATDLLQQNRNKDHKNTKSSSSPTNPVEKYLRLGYEITLADKNDILVTSEATAQGGSNNNKNANMTTRVSRTVIHGVVHCPHRRFALETLRRILHTEPLPQQILIFVADARKVEIVVDKLDAMGILAAPLHGGRGSEKTDRAAVSQALREGYVGIVVATELAARGLDAPLLTHVINLDLPTDASHYAHRAGRCGRGGRPGVVINFTTNPKERNVPNRFADNLGITMHTVEVRNSKLNIVDPESIEID